MPRSPRSARHSARERISRPLRSVGGATVDSVMRPLCGCPARPDRAGRSPPTGTFGPTRWRHFLGPNAAAGKISPMALDLSAEAAQVLADEVLFPAANDIDAMPVLPRE